MILKPPLNLIFSGNIPYPVYYLKNLLMTFCLDSHTTTESKPEMLSSVNYLIPKVLMCYMLLEDFATSRGCICFGFIGHARKDALNGT